MLGSLHLPFFLELVGIILAIGMTLHLIGKRKEPQVILSWSLSFFLFPFIGPLFYLLFGETRMEKYVRRYRNPSYIRHPLDLPGAPPYNTTPPLSFQEDHSSSPRYLPDHPLHYYASRVVMATQGFPPRPGNLVTLYTDGERFFSRMFQAFEQARTSIYVMFYLIRNDSTGAELLQILRRKVAEGVTVRLLYDHWGSFSFHFSSLRRRYRHSVPMAVFLPLLPWKSALNANFRNHRKIAVVDHTLAFTGGINIADEYRYGLWQGLPWHDLGVEIQGPAVRDLELIFCDDWSFATGEELPVGEYPEPFPHGTPVQVVTGGPDHPLEPISHLITTILSRSNTEATLITPYFIPDIPLLHTLSSLVLRGGKVNLVVPEVGNHFWVQRATESYYRDLFAIGIRPWLFEPGMLHTKLLLSDNLIALVGSPNLDIRSLKLNFEVALLLFAPTDLQKVREVTVEILQRSSPLVPERYARYPFLRRFQSSIARVISPIF